MFGLHVSADNLPKKIKKVARGASKSDYYFPFTRCATRNRRGNHALVRQSSLRIAALSIPLFLLGVGDPRIPTATSALKREKVLSYKCNQLDVEVNPRREARRTMLAIPKPIVVNKSPRYFLRATCEPTQFHLCVAPNGTLKPARFECRG